MTSSSLLDLSRGRGGDSERRDEEFCTRSVIQVRSRKTERRKGKAWGFLRKWSKDAEESVLRWSWDWNGDGGAPASTLIEVDWARPVVE